MYVFHSQLQKHYKKVFQRYIPHVVHISTGITYVVISAQRIFQGTIYIRFFSLKYDSRLMTPNALNQ